MSDTPSTTTEVPTSVTLELSLSEFLNVGQAVGLMAGMFGNNAVIPLAQRLSNQAQAIRDEHGIEALQAITDEQLTAEEAEGTRIYEEKMAEFEAQQAEEGQQVAQTAGL